MHLQLRPTDLQIAATLLAFELAWDLGTLWASGFPKGLRVGDEENWRCREDGQPPLKKKSSEPNGPKDCTLVYFILGLGLKAVPRAFVLCNQAGLLAHGSSYFPCLPTLLQQGSGSHGFRPRLQRRDRSRFSRDSLLGTAPDCCHDSIVTPKLPPTLLKVKQFLKLESLKRQWSCGTVNTPRLAALPPGEDGPSAGPCEFGFAHRTVL